ncbi:MAG: hypothetical protein KIS91_09745 [Anaerolineae bacterium]|nr:hypothetical protein [Anaerolineae bacterium]
MEARHVAAPRHPGPRGNLAGARRPHRRLRAAATWHQARAARRPPGRSGSHPRRRALRPGQHGDLAAAASSSPAAGRAGHRPVRYVTNQSSGKMGLALAEAARSPGRDRHPHPHHRRHAPTASARSAPLPPPTWARRCWPGC